ncbi:C40 family peptidase [Bacillaceae bacterium Marseille-Q3522]|nr:C40 family peptidase [Bacillaceae bacterium Marseille-Q3522]
MTVHEKWLVNVPVATLWTAYDSPREADMRAGNIQEWIQEMTYEEKLSLCKENLVQSQVLLGGEVIILDEHKNCYQVAVVGQASKKDNRGYPGWMLKEQLVKAPVDWRRADQGIAVITSKYAILYEDNENTMEVSFLTSLPFLAEEGVYIRAKIPNGTATVSKNAVTVFSSADEVRKGSGNEIVKCAEKFLGLPYLWGGMSSFGYDCSGFSYSMCKANGYVIPRDASEQAEAGKKIAQEELLPGDLLFFAYEEGKGFIHHVGIYCGNGEMIHAPKTGETVEVRKLAGTVYEKEFCGARRYWNETEES